MQFLLDLPEEERKFVDVLILPYWQEEKNSEPAFIREKIGVDLEFLSMLEADFKAETAEMLFSYMPKKTRVPRVILLGLGSKKNHNPASLRKVFAGLTVFCQKKKMVVLEIVFSEESKVEEVSAIVDGFCMANYSFDSLKVKSLEKNPSFFLKTVFLVGPKKSFEEAIHRHLEVMQSVNLVRNLVNGNADDVGAAHLALVAEQIAAINPSIKTTVLGQTELEKQKMGLLLAVNRGAENDPALILLEYKGDPDSSDVTAFIGKGITFDTGGLNLKPTGGIEAMKCDMAGAAAVLGIMKSIASLGLKKNVIGVIATAENAISRSSYKPGDVYISHSGKSVEITNTDAEGRLVLADAISYVQKNYAPSRMIDLATLTGGIIVAIGDVASGLFSNDQDLVAKIKKAAEVTGERVWEMPLFPEYRKALDSSIADIKNSAAGRKASPCTGAAFIEEFVEKGTPWAHLDIAGTAYLSESEPYYPSFATGVGVKLLTSFMENL